MSSLVLATRSAHKAQEIRHLLSEHPELEIVDLDQAGVAEDPAEDRIERFPTFSENALAKARYFVGLLGRVVLADDSGLCVDALGGAPGVHSKRFSGRGDLRGAPLDRANNALLLAKLQGRPLPERTAHYTCSVVLAHPDGREEQFQGECHGFILEEPRGTGGFGYDPLFYSPELEATFAEVDAARKNRVSHRARAIRAAARALDGG